LLEEPHLLVSWCARDTCDMAGRNEDHGRSRGPGVEDQGCSDTGLVLSGRTIERSVDAMCSLHHAQGDEEHEFLGLTSKLRSTVCRWFGLKTPGSGFSVLASKPAATVCQWFGLKIIGTVSYGLPLKLVAMVSPGLPLKLVASGFLVWASKLAAMVW
jgi:hypothetical protein